MWSRKSYILKPSIGNTENYPQAVSDWHLIDQSPVSIWWGEKKEQEIKIILLNKTELVYTNSYQHGETRYFSPAVVNYFPAVIHL